MYLSIHMMSNSYLDSVASESDTIGLEVRVFQTVTLISFFLTWDRNRTKILKHRGGGLPPGAEALSDPYLLL